MNVWIKILIILFAAAGALVLLAFVVFPDRNPFLLVLATVALGCLLFLFDDLAFLGITKRENEPKPNPGSDSGEGPIEPR